MALLEVPSPASEVGDDRRRRWWPLLLVGVLVVVSVGLVWQQSRDRQPRAFQDYGTAGSYGTKHGVPGATYYVTITDPRASEHVSVVLHGAAPHGLTDSTGASFGYFLCTLRPGPEPTGVESTADAHQSCARLVAADDADMSLADQQLLVAVTPGDTGAVAFHGLDVHYALDGHDGTQRIGPDVRIRATRPG